MVKPAHDDEEEVTSERIRLLRERVAVNFEGELLRIAIAVEKHDQERKSMIETIDKLTTQVEELNRVLSSGKGGLEILFLLAKVSAAVTAIGIVLGGLVYIVRNVPLK